MSAEKLFEHKCDVYHVVKSQCSVGYGLPDNKEFDYPKAADLANVPCHFCFGSTQDSVVQGVAAAERNSSVKLLFPSSIEIKLNDLVVDVDTGLKYTAGLPKSVRNSHKYVYVTPKDAQRYL